MTILVKGRPIIVEENGYRYLAVKSDREEIPTSLEVTISDDGSAQLWQYGYAPDAVPPAPE